MTDFFFSNRNSFRSNFTFAGGEFFIQGAIFLSLILGIPQIVIGLTVVSLGTAS